MAENEAAHSPVLTWDWLTSTRVSSWAMVVAHLPDSK